MRPGVRRTGRVVLDGPRPSSSRTESSLGRDESPQFLLDIDIEFKFYFLLHGCRTT